MTFLQALLTVAKDRRLGFKRTVWETFSILYLTENIPADELRWTETGETCQIGGPDPTGDLTPEDLTATDWEVI